MSGYFFSDFIKMDEMTPKMTNFNKNHHNIRDQDSPLGFSFLITRSKTITFAGRFMPGMKGKEMILLKNRIFKTNELLAFTDAVSNQSCDFHYRKHENWHHKLPSCHLYPRQYLTRWLRCSYNNILWQILVIGTTCYRNDLTSESATTRII